jgi:hypothetical protein
LPALRQRVAEIEPGRSARSATICMSFSIDTSANLEIDGWHSSRDGFPIAAADSFPSSDGQYPN